MFLICAGLFGNVFPYVSFRFAKSVIHGMSAMTAQQVLRHTLMVATSGIISDLPSPDDPAADDDDEDELVAGPAPVAASTGSFARNL
jgi:hypothetical protein